MHSWLARDQAEVPLTGRQGHSGKLQDQLTTMLKATRGFKLPARL